MLARGNAPVAVLLAKMRAHFVRVHVEDVVDHRLLPATRKAFGVAEWTEDRVKLLPLRSDPAALQVTVHTQITDSRGSIVAVDFRLRQTADGWKIFDVIVDGVSYVRNYHDDTDAEVTQKGLDAAIARLAAGADESIDATQRSSRPAPRRPP